MNSYYGELWKVYKSASTWGDFVKAISHGRSKWVFLEAIETGWKNRIRKDLLERYDDTSKIEIDTLLLRYESIVYTTPTTVSVIELKREIMRCALTINVLRGYLRHAYFTAFDNPDDIIWTLDEELTTLGTGTPTREECASSYTITTGKVVDPGAVAIPENVADEIATCLAAQIEDLYKHLGTQTRDGRASKIESEMKKLDGLHSALTGKSLLGSEFSQTSPRA